MCLPGTGTRDFGCGQIMWVEGRWGRKEGEEGGYSGSLSIEGGWWETALVIEAWPALPEEALVKQSRYFRSGKW